MGANHSSCVAFLYHRHSLPVQFHLNFVVYYILIWAVRCHCVLVAVAVAVAVRAVNVCASVCVHFTSVLAICKIVAEVRFEQAIV